MNTLNSQYPSPAAAVTPTRADADIASTQTDHEIAPRAVPLKDADTPSPKAAEGDDDLMSKQQQQSMPSVDQVKGKWKQQVGAAKIAWGKLTDDELLKTEGQAQKLTGLVQERYALSREQADKQVATFFEKN